MLPGRLSIGFVVSTTMICCVVVAPLPAASVAVQMIVVVPSANWLPAGDRVIVTGPARSLPIAMPGSTIAPSAPVASAITSAGGVIDGSVVSTTTICCVAVLSLPAASVAVQVIVVVPSANWLPAGDRVIVTDPTRSLPIAIPGSTIAPSGPVASAVTSAGGVIDGSVVSTTVMFCVAV